MKGKIMKNSDPSLLVEKLMAAGFTLTADGSRLRVAPADLLTDELRAGIREHKAALISILAAEAAPAVQSTTDTTPTTTMQPEPKKPPLSPHELAMPWQHRKEPPDECPCCGLSRFWKLRTGPPGTPWVCWRCHPPLDSMDIVIITK